MGKRKYSIKDCHKKAEERGGKCLSEEYKSIKTKYRWECENGHIWSALFSNIRQGSWCALCYKTSLQDCIDIATSKHGKCLSDQYNSKVKSKWQCKSGHIWAAHFSNIKRGYWCPKCAPNYRLSLEDCMDFATSKGGRCLSSRYINGRSKLKWQCKNGHIWESKFVYIRQGQWCPKCSKKNQHKLYDIYKMLYPNSTIYWEYRGFDWLKTRRGGRQEIDIYDATLKIAIEYNGEQHYMPVQYLGGEKRLRETRRLDQNKKAKIRRRIKKGEIKAFIIFSYREKITEVYVKNKIEQILKSML